MADTDCLQKIIEFSFSNKSLFTYMLYDTSIEETRCTKNKNKARDNGYEVTRCMKASVREMLDRLYIIAYLFKMKFRHPVAKASC
jgi:hypothetical protein